MVSSEWTVPEDTAVFPTTEPATVGQPATLALYRTADGDLVAMGFTSLAQLVAVFGPRQPWVAYKSDVVPRLLEGSGVTRILIDAAVTHEASPH
jgi:hypothetical protein